MAARKKAAARPGGPATRGVNGTAGDLYLGKVGGVQRARKAGQKTTRAVKASKIKITGQRATSALRAGGRGSSGGAGSLVSAKGRRGTSRLSAAQAVSMQSKGGRVGMKRTGAVRLAQG